MKVPREERRRVGEVMERVEEENRLDARVESQPRRVGHRERHVRELQPGGVAPRPVDGGGAVIVPGKPDVRQAARQLACDLAGSAPDVGGHGHTAKRAAARSAKRRIVRYPGYEGVNGSYAWAANSASWNCLSDAGEARAARHRAPRIHRVIEPAAVQRAIRGSLGA